MVVGHNHVDAPLAEPVNLVLGGDAVVDGHNEIGLAIFQHAVKCGLSEAVALAKAVRNVGTCAPAQLAQAQRENASGAHAINVKVTKDGDVLPRPHSALDAVYRLGHAGND